MGPATAKKASMQTESRRLPSYATVRCRRATYFNRSSLYMTKAYSGLGDQNSGSPRYGPLIWKPFAIQHANGGSYTSNLSETTGNKVQVSAQTSNLRLSVLIKWQGSQ